MSSEPHLTLRQRCAKQLEILNYLLQCMGTNILSSATLSFFGVTSIGVTSSPLLVAGSRSTDIIPLLGLFLGGGAGLLSTDPLDGGDRVPLTAVSTMVALVGLGCDEDVDTLEADLAGLVLVGVGKSSKE